MCEVVDGLNWLGIKQVPDSCEKELSNRQLHKK